MAKRTWRENRKAHAQFIYVQFMVVHQLFTKQRMHNIGNKDKHGIRKA